MLRLTLATVAAFTATAVATSLYSSAVHGDLRPDWVVSTATARRADPARILYNPAAVAIRRSSMRRRGRRGSRRRR